ncbi:MAG: hypothetical protein KF878_20235 [Planctomycetes bacterium]|nr:hypothetical protein [Planctomycetota bacterium]
MRQAASLPGYEPEPAAPHAAAHEVEDPAAKTERLRRMRQSASLPGYEPEPADAHEVEDPAAKTERLRRMRQSASLPGYEPEPPPAAAPSPVAATTPVTDPDDDARFRPPSFTPVTDPDDDARFAPPAAHRAAAPAGLQGVVDRPTRPLDQELGLILRYPATSLGLFVVSSGALLVFLIDLLFSGVRILPPGTGLALLPLALYIYSYLVCVAEAACQGREELPDWPDLGATIGLGWRLLLASAAAFAPAVLAGCLLVKASGPGIDRARIPSVGRDAVNLAGVKGLVAPGTRAADAEFVTLDGAPAPLAGGWSVLGLLGKDTADDTGTDEAFANLPSAGFGVVIDHAAQIHDLERVGRALAGKVQVYAAFADPRCKIVWGRHPYAVPASVRERFGYSELDYTSGDDDPHEVGPDDEGSDVDEALGRARDLAGRNAAAHGARVHPLAQSPFTALRFIRTEGYVFPDPFAQVRRLPAVYVLDPQGVVRREYATGVDDEKLHGDLLDLLRGGKGDAVRQPLPPSAYGLSERVGRSGAATLATGLLLLALLFGVLYFPMALLLMVAFNDGWMAFQYPAGLRAIGVAARDYAVVAGVFVGASVAGWLLQALLTATVVRALPAALGALVQGYLHQWLWLYGALVSTYAAGRFYYRNRDAIGWFNR